MLLQPMLADYQFAVIIMLLLVIMGMVLLMVAQFRRYAKEYKDYYWKIATISDALTTHKHATEQKLEEMQQAHFASDVVLDMSRFVKTANACPPTELAAIVTTCQSTQAAFIIAVIKPELAAAVFALLPQAKSQQILTKLLQRDFSDLRVDEITSLGQRLQIHDTAVNQKLLRAIVNIFYCLDTTTSDNFLHWIAAAPNYHALKPHLLKWQDIATMDDRTVQRALREISNETLLLALYDSPKAVAAKFFSNLSRRAGELLQEDIASTTQVAPHDVWTARQKILAHWQAAHHR